ncbi:MAG: hypothetical protein CMP48_06040 [Rickettsiales bacterium]|nr:hypothetical protein [Rickettsiales bacterium]
MLYQYLLASWRNLLKHRLHTILNIAGLAIGLAACLIIVSYVHYELSYDKHHPNSENIYRIALNRIYPNQEKTWAAIAPIVAPTITEILPEVENYTRFYPEKLMFAPEGQKMQEESITVVDSGFFDLFKTPVLHGQVTNDFFKRKDGLILTQSAAKKFFKNENAIGRVFQMILGEQKQSFVVEAVIADPLATSHFSYEVICSMEAIHPPDWIMKSWGTWAMYGYIKVHEETDIVELTNKINKISEQHQSIGDDGYQEWLNAGNYYRYFLQPLTSIHLYSNLKGEFEANSSELFVYFFAIVGVFILLMAIVNFVNLATARASQRTREVGIRKTVGASRNDLIKQYLMESTLLSLVALLIALPITQLFIPYFNQIIGKSISLDVFSEPIYLALLSLTPILLGLLAGFYPALYLSHFRPSAIFQKVLLVHGKQRLRHALVVGQLCIAVILLAGTTTVYRQMHFISNKPLGFDKEQVISVSKLPFNDEKIMTFANRAIELPGVNNVSISSFPIDGIRTGMAVRNMEQEENWVNMNSLNVDEKFIPTMGFELLSGRNFRLNEVDKESENPSKVILNATGAKYMGWTPDEAVNKVILDGEFSMTIIGVVEDFQIEPLYQPVGPFILASSGFPPQVRAAAIRLDPRNMSQAIASLDGLWSKFAPDQLFEFNYLDESMAQYYEAEKLTGQLFVLFSGLAIFVCCLGLFGLMGFVVERRAKEVGVRKVMGASINHIVLLLSKDYIKLVLISSVIALPIAWWGLNEWLESFAYRIDNSVWLLLLSGVLVMIISWVTVAYYAYKAAVDNPIKALRSE